MSICDVIRRAASEHRARTALREVAADSGTGGASRSITYGDLYDRCLRFHGALESRAVKRGDRVAALLDNSIEMVTTEWTCLLAGYLWVGLNVRAALAETQAIIDDCEPAVLVIGSRHRSLGHRLRLPRNCERIVVGGAEDEWERLVAESDPRDPETVPAEQPVRIRYTSGTSGRPKGAVLPRRCYDASFEAVSALLNPRRGDVLLQTAPMTHAAGAMLLPHVAVGALALLMDRFAAAACVEVVRRCGVTAVFLVPTMLVRLLDSVDAADRMRSLRTVVYGGAPMPVDRLIRALELYGPVFVQIYGLTESTWPVTALTHEHHCRGEGEDERAWRDRLASCGRPTSIGTLRIAGPDGRDVEPGAIGEICVRGRNTMSGYWRWAPGPQGIGETDKGLDGEGWVHTGDLAIQDRQGQVTIVDRLHDMIISGGFNIYPREVEDALTSHPAVLEAAVVGRPSAEWGETVHAFVVIRPQMTATAEALVAHCVGRLAAYKKPHSLELVAELPKNPSGKILRRTLRDRLRPLG